MYLSFWAVRKTKVKCSINNVRVLKQTERERRRGWKEERRRCREVKIAKKIAKKMLGKLSIYTRMKQRGIKQGFLYYWELQNVIEESEKRSRKMAIFFEDIQYIGFAILR